MLREGRWSHQPSGLSCSGQAVAEAVWRAGIRVPELWAGGQSLSMGITASPLRTHFLSRLRRGAAASTRNCSCELPQGARPPADRGSTWGWGGAQGPGWPAPMACRARGPRRPGWAASPWVGLGCGAALAMRCSLPVCTSPFPCRPLAVPGREQPALSHVDWLS